MMLYVKDFKDLLKGGNPAPQQIYYLDPLNIIRSFPNVPCCSNLEDAALTLSLTECTKSAWHMYHR